MNRFVSTIFIICQIIAIKYVAYCKNTSLTLPYELHQEPPSSSRSFKINASIVKLCGTQNVTFTIDEKVDSATYKWAPSNLFIQDYLDTQELTLEKTTKIYLYQTLNGITTTDSITIEVIQDANFNKAFDSINVCRGSKHSFGDLTGFKKYSFNPNTGIDFTDPNNPILTVSGSFNYLLEITSSIDTTCKLTYPFKVISNDLEFSNLPPTDYRICRPDSIIVNYILIPQNLQIIWEPVNTTINPLSNQSISFFPTKSTTYRGTASLDGCIKSIEFNVQVDSLPNLDLSLIVEKPYYCSGEILTILSPDYVNPKYPNIQFDWSKSLGELTSKNNQNITFSTIDTFTYVRRTTNGACFRSDSIKINVIDAKPILDLQDTSVCINEPVEVNVLSDLGTPEWTPEEGLSCKECNTVIITTATSKTFTATIDYKGCPIAASVNINVKMPFIQFNYDVAEVCPGEPVTTTIITPNVTNINWDPNQACDTCKTNIISSTENKEFTVTGIVDGCPASGIAHIKIKEPTQIQLIPELFTCPNIPVQIILPTELGDAIWTANLSLSCLNCNNPIVTTGANATFFANFTDDLGCHIIGSQNVTILPPHNFEITASTVSGIFPVGGDVTLTITNPVPGATYTWFNNGQSLGEHPSPFETIITTEQNNFMAQSTSVAELCAGQGLVNIVGITPIIKIPNAFTPNGDGTNDEFIPIFDEGIEITEITIFNRWGQTIYKNTNEQGWDGKFNEKNAPADNYLYKINYKFKVGGNISESKGKVTLIR